MVLTQLGSQIRVIAFERSGALGAVLINCSDQGALLSQL